MISFESLPPTLIATQVLPYCTVRELVSLSATSKNMRAIVVNLHVWRKLTQVCFRDKYYDLYENLPKSIPFFNILAVETRFCSLEKKARVLDKYYEPCNLLADIAEDLTCEAVKMVVGNSCIINGVNYNFNKLSEIIRAASAVIGI